MKLAIIAAIAKNRVIGKEGKIPWHIPEDLQRFKHLTTGHTVLMGRRTFDSIGKPLSNRRNIVLSSQAIPGVEIYSSVENSLEAVSNEELVFVIGGAQLFQIFLDLADELFLTLLDAAVRGDTFFPPYEHLLDTQFRPIRKEHHTGFRFEDYVRRESLK